MHSLAIEKWQLMGCSDAQEWQIMKLHLKKQILTNVKLAQTIATAEMFLVWNDCKCAKTKTFVKYFFLFDQTVKIWKRPPNGSGYFLYKPSFWDVQREKDPLKNRALLKSMSKPTM